MGSMRAKKAALSLHSKQALGPDVDVSVGLIKGSGGMQSGSWSPIENVNHISGSVSDFTHLLVS